MGPREGRPGPDWGGPKSSPVGDRAEGPALRRAGATHRTPPAQAVPLHPRPLPLLARNSFPPPRARHPVTGKGSFPAAAARLPDPRRGYLLQKRDGDRGQGEGEAARRSEGRSPRRGRWAAAAVSSRSLLTALPLLCAEAASPAGRRHPPTDTGVQAGGAEPAPGAHLLLRETQRGPAAGGTERWEAEMGEGAGYGIRTTTVLRSPRLSPTYTLPALSSATAESPLRMQWYRPRYGKRRRPGLVRLRRAAEAGDCRDWRPAELAGSQAVMLLNSGDSVPSLPGNYYNDVSERCFQQKPFPLSCFRSV